MCPHGLRSDVWSRNGVPGEEGTLGAAWASWAWAEDPPELHMRGRYKLGKSVRTSVPSQNHHIKGPDREASQAKGKNK
ncbi:hypothetical protein NDU88_005831 [Pleurodeles waltl]|uniref:Uncharacterized protein n=1 Tax=Pleurodeles waltl TaxID=8319 RepID=A0AAV7WYT2_PLEWA|nr:hypothetical protein NDU88_005831 [Pleurodeles waltl]